MWQDEFRICNDTFPYSCRTPFVFPTEKLWIPDMVISNSFQRYLPMQRDRENLLIRSDGLTLHQFSGEIQFKCSLDLSLFPFDNQICSLHMESWLLNINEQIFAQYSIKNDSFLKNATENEEWMVRGIELKVSKGHFLPIADNTFAHVIFELLFKFVKFQQKIRLILFLNLKENPDSTF